MNSRERVLCALNHEEPDRVPIFFGTSGVTTMLASAYEHLKAHLCIERETKVFWRALGYTLLDEEVMVLCHSDARPLIPRAPLSALPREISEREFVDAWGITWSMEPQSLYFEISAPPLANATIDDLEEYPWPNLTHPSRFAGLAEQARAIHAAGYAVVALSGITPFEYSHMMRGYENWFGDLAGDPDFAQALLRKITTLQKDATMALLDEAGEHIDVIVTGDDLGSQQTTLISPEMYRRMLKPLHAELFGAIKRRTAAKIFYHSDGNIISLLNDLIEVGVDLINPIHVAAGDMGNTARLKHEFGDRLSFCGGIDTTRVLPNGSTADVRAEVRRRISDLGHGGGYILAAVHCVQPDVPPENVLAMFDEAFNAGRYPLRLGGRCKR